MIELEVALSELVVELVFIVSLLRLSLWFLWVVVLLFESVFVFLYSFSSLALALLFALGWIRVFSLLSLVCVTFSV